MKRNEFFNRKKIMSKTVILIFLLFITSTFGLFSLRCAQATEYKNYIYYHCADWGPSLENPEEEKIYFIKQIIFEEDKKRFGNVVYFCSMNPDGSDKKEITKLFENTKHYLDLNGNTSFMDICYTTKKAAIAFSAGGAGQTGLWLINLDGSDFRRIVEHERRDDFRFRVNHPSWFPDGEHLIYEEKWLQPSIQYYVVKIDKNGKNKTYLTKKEDGEIENRYPVVSPNGKKIAYTHFWYKPDATPRQRKRGRDLWLMDVDGKNKRMLYDNYLHYTDYPEWSPDGSKLYVVSYSDFTLVDAVTGKQLFKELLKFDGKPWGPKKVHWSMKYGYLMDGGGSIGLVKSDLSYYVPLKASGGHVLTENKRDISQEEYKWGQ